MERIDGKKAKKDCSNEGRPRNGTFPAPIRLGPRAIGFYEDEIEAWQQSRPREWADPVIDG